MKRALAIILIGLIGLSSACASAGKSVFSEAYLVASAAPKDYKFAADMYSKDKIKIEYPQLELYPDAKQMKKINKQIETIALAIAKSYKATDTVAIGYEIRMANANMVSVSFAGDATSPGWAHPVTVCYTANVSNTGKKLMLKDFYNITTDFIESILYQKYPSSRAEAVEYLKKADQKELLKLFKNADKNYDSQVFSAFGKQGMIFYISVPHALGDFTTLEVPYASLSPFERK